MSITCATIIFILKKNNNNIDLSLMNSSQTPLRHDLECIQTKLTSVKLVIYHCYLYYRGKSINNAKYWDLSEGGTFINNVTPKAGNIMFVKTDNYVKNLIQKNILKRVFFGSTHRTLMIFARRGGKRRKFQNDTLTDHVFISEKPA